MPDLRPADGSTGQPADLPGSALTVYVCPVCGTVDLDERYTGGHDFDRHPDCHRNRRVAVRYVPAAPTPEMVDLAARALCAEDWPHDEEDLPAWDALRPETREAWRDSARTALTAAARIAGAP